MALFLAQTTQLTARCRIDTSMGSRLVEVEENRSRESKRGVGQHLCMVWLLAALAWLRAPFPARATD